MWVTRESDRNAEEAASDLLVAEETSWFALSVVPRKEKATAQTLRAKGYEDFLPMYSVRRRWSDRIKNVEMPLFPGYVFCRFDPRIRLPILKIPSVMAVAGIGKTPEPISDSEIADLQTVCRSGLNPVPCPYLTVGAKVRLREGPLAGVEGILLDAGDTQLVLSVTLLQRSVSIHVERDWIAPLQIYKTFQ
jgi:transcription antitermination factor NusG